MTDEDDALLEALLSALLLSLITKLAWKRCFAEAGKLRKGKGADSHDPDSYEKGLRKGYEDGFEEGYRRCAVICLRGALRARFGPLPADIVAKVDDASFHDIMEWLRRVPQARVLADVFCCERPALPGPRPL